MKVPAALDPIAAAYQRRTAVLARVERALHGWTVEQLAELATELEALAAAGGGRVDITPKTTPAAPVPLQHGVPEQAPVGIIERAIVRAAEDNARLRALRKKRGSP